MELELEMCDYFWPNFVLVDAAFRWCGRIDYVYDGGTSCLPESGEVTMNALYGCHVDNVDFRLTGRGQTDTDTDRQTPFFLYANTGAYDDLKEGDLFGRDGFELGVEYTVSAIPDNDPYRGIKRCFKFKE